MFYDQLKQACKDNNTSITAVLKKIGIGTANGTYWKNGSSPSSDIVIQLSEFLNVSTDFLLKGKKSSIQDNLSEDEKRLLNTYTGLCDWCFSVHALEHHRVFRAEHSAPVAAFLVLRRRQIELVVLHGIVEDILPVLPALRQVEDAVRGRIGPG